MGNIFNRLSLFFAQLLVSMVMPPLFVPRIARLRVTRLLVAFCFGRLYGNKYQHVIDSFHGKYGLAMAEGLSKAKDLAGHNISVIVDCGTGTGFATKQVSPKLIFNFVDFYDELVRQRHLFIFKIIETNNFAVAACSHGLMFFAYHFIFHFKPV